MRSFCKNELHDINNENEIVQINHSFTKLKGSVRGMHYQLPPHSEVKIVRCLKGSVLDVIVDLRKGSPTFLKHHGELLSQDNIKMMYIPEGFAHGFQTLEEDCELLYLHSEFYTPSSESAIRYDDPLVGIEWPLPVSDISERDKNHALLSNDFSGIEI